MAKVEKLKKTGIENKATSLFFLSSFFVVTKFFPLLVVRILMSVSQLVLRYISGKMGNVAKNGNNFDLEKLDLFSSSSSSSSFFTYFS